MYKHSAPLTVAHTDASKGKGKGKGKGSEKGKGKASKLLPF